MKIFCPLLFFISRINRRRDTIVRGMGQRDIQLKEVLGAGSAEATRDVALLGVSRVEGVPLLLSGVITEHIHQMEGKVGVGGEGGKVEDSPNHGLGCRLKVSLAVDVNDTETRVARPASRVGCLGCRSSRFGFLLAIPQLLDPEPKAEYMARVS